MKTYWYLTRASGTVALILLTIAIVIGILSIGRVHSRRWPRFVIDGVHRSSSLLAVVFLAIHIATAVLDSFAPISLLDAIVPFAGSYRPIWLGLGAAAFDLLLAVTVTSLLRQRLGHRLWRAVHWLAYATWPIAVVHALGTGSDVQQTWLQLTYAVSGAAVIAAVLWRIAIGWPTHRRIRLGALGALAAVLLAISLWLPQGPLGHDWAKRAGHPDEPAARVRARRKLTSLPRLLAGVGSRPMSLDRHRKIHGDLPRRRPTQFAAELERSGLRGRGGGAFPLSVKLASVRRSRGSPVVVVNGSEGEPMSTKDRLLMWSAPHLVLDGAVTLAEAAGADELIVCVDELEPRIHEALRLRDRTASGTATAGDAHPRDPDRICHRAGERDRPLAQRRRAHPAAAPAASVRARSPAADRRSSPTSRPPRT